MTKSVTSSRREVQFLRRILEIYSPSGKEGELAQFLREEMDQMGMRPRIDRVGNVVGVVGRGDPFLLLCGHMDTIPGFLPVRIEKDKIYGRGSVDAKSSLAAMILAASGFVGRELGKEIIVACLVDEEGNSVGMRELMKGLGVKYALFGEPSQNRGIIVGYRGGLSLEISCQTEGGHVAASPRYQNAIEKAFELWREMKSRVSVSFDMGLFYSTNICLTKISGGSYRSVVPGNCCMSLDLRFPPDVEVNDLLKKVQEMISDFKKRNPMVEVSYTVGDMSNGYQIRRSSLVCKALFRAVVRVKGSKARFYKKTGTSDINLLHGKNIEAVSFGPGDSSLEHTDKEWVDINEYLEAIRIYGQFVDEMLSTTTV